MEDLRLVGVDKDGRRLVLTDPSGKRYGLAIDDALRAAARHDTPRMGQLQIAVGGSIRPREVQALIRSGLSADEVAERTGWNIDRIVRYEGPVLDERRYVADLAQESAVDGYGATTLGRRVAERMMHREVDPATAQWDAWRQDNGVWLVVCRFEAGGRDRQARWDFVAATRTLTPRDDEARWLSEDAEAGTILTGGVPVRAQTRVYDVEAEGGITPRRERRPTEPLDLMTAMRERSKARRGTRRPVSPSDVPGSELIPSDALPLEPLPYDPGGADLPPAAHPRPHAVEDSALEEAAASDPEPQPDGPEHVARPGRGGLEPEEAEAEDFDLDPAADPADPTREIEQVGAALDAEDEWDEADEANGADEDDANDSGAAQQDPSAAGEPEDEARSTRRSRRTSVPSWDDIVFGTRSRPGQD